MTNQVPIDVKLEAVEGSYSVSWVCPDCGEKNGRDLREVLSPTLGAPTIELDVYCVGGEDGEDGWEECGYYDSVKLLIEIKVSLTGDQIDLAEYVGAHLSAMGACEDADPDEDESLCESASCTYCQMARAVQPEICGPPLTEKKTQFK